MRQTRLATTMDVFRQSLEPEVRKAINSIHRESEATGTEGGKLGARVKTNASSTKEEERTPERERENAGCPPRGNILLFAANILEVELGA